MKKLISFLNGKKTYIGIAAGTTYLVLIYLKLVENNELIWGAITAWTGVSLRSAIK